MAGASGTRSLRMTFRMPAGALSALVTRMSSAGPQHLGPQDGEQLSHPPRSDALPRSSAPATPPRPSLAQVCVCMWSLLQLLLGARPSTLSLLSRQLQTWIPGGGAGVTGACVMRAASLLRHCLFGEQARAQARVLPHPSVGGFSSLGERLGFIPASIPASSRRLDRQPVPSPPKTFLSSALACENPCS